MKGRGKELVRLEGRRDGWIVRVAYLDDGSILKSAAVTDTDSAHRAAKWKKVGKWFESGPRAAGWAYSIAGRDQLARAVAFRADCEGLAVVSTECAAVDTAIVLQLRRNAKAGPVRSTPSTSQDRRDRLEKQDADRGEP